MGCDHDGMADTTARTIRLLSLLQRRRYWPGPELADRLEVSERTVRRDIDRLRVLGYTVHAEPGVDGGYRLGTTDGDAVLLLDDDEATALAVALHNAATTGTAELAEASLGALTKVLTMLGPTQRRRVENVGAATSFHSSAARAVPDLTVLDTVATACRDGVRLSFEYRAGDGAETSRYVEPVQLVSLAGRWYLVAFDGDRADWRTFRVDRITSPVPARNTFAPRTPPADDLSDYVRRNLRELAARYRVVVDVEVPADRVRAEFGFWVDAEATDASSCRMTMEADSFAWPTHVLAALDAPFTVVAPPELRDHLHAVAARFA